MNVPGLSAVRSRIAAIFPTTPAAPPSQITGSGTPAIVLNTTEQAPPNSAMAALSQVESSSQVEENTQTGLGIGAGNVATVVSMKKPGPNSILWLVFLGIVLVIFYLIDKGKL